MRAKHLAAAILICLCFGSIHAYGVLLRPLEQWLGISRTLASLGYGLAILCLTLGVFLNGQMQARFSLGQRLMGCGLVAGAGLCIAGLGQNPGAFLLGFSGLYGLANGVAYAVSLEVAARAMPGREAQGMGIATAAYGLGAVLFAQLSDGLMPDYSVATLLMGLAGLALVVCVGSASLVAQESAPVGLAQASNFAAPSLWFIWLGFLLGAFAGLMVLAHAPALVAWKQADAVAAGRISGLVSLGSVAGGYLGGWLAVKLPGRGAFFVPLVAQSVAVFGLGLPLSLPWVMGALALVGLCYGALISVVPGEVRRLSGPDHFAHAYGKVFTAWGAAGVAGPLAAGYVFDLTAGYGAALMMAAFLSVLAMASIAVRP
jgi:OFA family oxalate/formate antiporter-like MFS transporter